jgi:hypothetical protein
MCRIKLGPSTFFKLFVAAATLALGLAAASLRPRQSALPPASPASEAPAQPVSTSRAGVSVRDTFAKTDAKTEEDAVFKGGYTNYVYGYSVTIPAGMVGLGAPPPAPQHGFGIDLDHPRSTAWIRGTEFPKSYVYVDGSYNSLGWKRLDEAVNSHLSFLHEKGREVSEQVPRESRLGELPAVRVITRYEQDGVDMVSDQIIAFGVEEDGEASVVYMLGLSTPHAKYERDRPALEEIRKSWCLQPPE